MFRIFANNVYPSMPTDNFTFITHGLDASSDLHTVK